MSGGGSIIATRPGRCRRAGSTRARTAGPAALRELEEETGIAPRLVEQVACHPQQLRYDIPEAIASRLWGGKWKGQLQDWYLARFLGTDGTSTSPPKHPEFSHWKWVEPHLLPELIVPFKREMYREIVEGFGVLDCASDAG